MEMQPRKGNTKARNLFEQLTRRLFRISADVATIFNLARHAEARESRGNRLFYYLWLLGPFCLLVERTPADIWVVLIGVTFLFQISKNAIDRIKLEAWHWACGAFVLGSLFSAVTSMRPSYSTVESLIWLRFPLLALAATVFFRDRRDLFAGFLLVVGTSVLIMFGILSIELIVEGHKAQSRLAWPYGDLVPGSFLAKFGAPVFFLLFAQALTSRSGYNFEKLILCGLFLVFVILTGERMNTLIALCGMFTIAVFSLQRATFLLLFTISLLFTLGVLELLGLQLVDRFILQSMAQLPTSPHSEYFKIFAPALITFQDSPIIGMGPGNYRFMCPTYGFDIEVFRCDNHPHNFYIQFLVENGVVGLTLAVLMIGALIGKTFWIATRNRRNAYGVAGFILPLAVFFPFSSTADWYGQWNNIFMWSGLAISLSLTAIASDRNSVETSTNS